MRVVCELGRTRRAALLDGELGVSGVPLCYQAEMEHARDTGEDVNQIFS